MPVDSQAKPGTGRRLEAQRSVGKTMQALGTAAREAARVLALASTEAKNAALRASAAELRGAAATIVEANKRDLAAARDAGRPASFLDRLMLDARRIDGMAKGLEEIAALPDPVGAMMAEWTRSNGLRIERVR